MSAQTAFRDERSRGEIILDLIEDEVMMRLNPSGEECPWCGGEGYIEGECTCGEDCCCCAEPTPPRCTECRRFAAKYKREVRVEVIRSLDVEIAAAWLKQEGRWRADCARDLVLANIHAGRAACDAFTPDERADSACWVEGLL